MTSTTYLKKSDCMFIFFMLLSSNHLLFQPRIFVYYIASQLHAIVFGEVPMRNLASLNWACQIPNYIAKQAKWIILDMIHYIMVFMWICIMFK